MRSTAIALLAATLAFLAGPVFAQGTSAGDAGKKSQPAAVKAETPADDQPIRAAAEDFVKAFNAGDAQAMGALWTTDAEYTEESGRTIRGRAGIEKHYGDFFRQFRGATIALTIESIRFPTPDTAVEKGVARLKSSSGDAETAARYSVLHVKRDGRWLISAAQDAPYQPESNQEALKDLDWLIGEWQVQTKNRTARMKFEWMPEKNFIKNTYTVTKEGQPPMSGTQIIGWNPNAGRIVSWHFDPKGGFGTGVWLKEGSKWLIESFGVHRDGSQSRSVNILTPVDANSYTWQSTKRTIEGTTLPKRRSVKVVRVQPGS